MKLTIVTVCKNDVVGLKKTYKSILQQSIKDYEWIIVDGDSKDRTLEFLKTIEKNKRYTWISEDDNGIYDAMNKGINISSGNYIIFLNSGDIFADDEVIYDVLKAISNNDSELKLLYGTSIDITKDGQQLFRKSRKINSYWKAMITQHQAMIFNSSELKKSGYSNKYKLSADYELVCKLIKKYPDGILQLDRVICKYQLGGLSDIRRLKALKEDVDIRRSIIGLPAIIVYGLYCMHFIHYFVKKYSWWIHEKIRY